MKGKYKFCPLCGNNLTSGNVENRRKLICRKCGWINYKNPLPVAVCVAKNKQDKILIVKRNIPPGINKWALPGGFIEQGESPEDACLRELREETGIKGKIRKLIGVYVQKTRIYESVLVIGYEIDVLKDFFSESSEIKEARFVNRKALPYIAFSTHRKMIAEAFRNND